MRSMGTRFVRAARRGSPDRRSFRGLAIATQDSTGFDSSLEVEDKHETWTIDWGIKGGARTLANLFDVSYLPSPLVMSWKRAQIHAESMLVKLGLGPGSKGKKDLRGKKAFLYDDGLNPYRTMCFTVAAKILKRRGAEVETAVPGPAEKPHVKIVDLQQQPKLGTQRPRGRR